MEQSPAAVMARLVMQCALHAEWVDDALRGDSDPDGEETRELLCSQIVAAMDLLAQRQRPRAPQWSSPYALSQLGPAVAKLHDSMSRLRPDWGRALLKDGVGLLLGGGSRFGRRGQTSVGGYQLRVLDGERASLKCTPGPHGCVHEIATDEPAAGSFARLRALPVYAPESGMIVDLVPYERGQIHERAFIGSLLESVGDNELWIVRGRFGADALLGGWPRVGSAFVMQDHGCAPAYQTLDDPQDMGELDGGRVYEQRVVLAGNPQSSPTFRRIEWRDGKDGEQAASALAMLTNVPESRLGAHAIVALLRMQPERITSLSMDAVFNGAALADVPPRAALLAAAILAIAHNTLVAMVNAVDGELGLGVRDIERLCIQMASGVCETYKGMMIALPPECWRRYDQMIVPEVGEIVRCLAEHVDPRSRRRQKRDRAASKAQEEGRALTLERLLYGHGETVLTGSFNMRTIAMATRDFSSNPSKALRHASEALVMVTKYNRPIALLVSIEDWNRLMLEVRESGFSRGGDSYIAPTPIVDLRRSGSSLN
ncbi:type II toxin-antitoxin system Phd/YefM family antitoxin [Paraburkholderia sp. ZP32-5]|uniref:type II toxin-antitoxin system Phd/YefM family antitoxin n=1 Tax=Paraburkholderia sp. ZP32-5 TaxID=2883245 RepID=UPI001F211F91|nr:type II toxin-antitoxin system Phd/YefM family antitoxin [Paraburkholderia sp. ZP32-5]